MSTELERQRREIAELQKCLATATHGGIPVGYETVNRLIELVREDERRKMEEEQARCGADKRLTESADTPLELWQVRREP